eukprot:scaffold1957_cov110-Isochrysis_galbana.AAC.8
MRPTTQNRELACARQRSWSDVQAVEPMSPVVMRSARPIFVPPCPPLPPLWLRRTLRNERMRFPLPLATSTGGCMQGSVAHGSRRRGSVLVFSLPSPRTPHPRSTRARTHTNECRTASAQHAPRSGGAASSLGSLKPKPQACAPAPSSI